jgi:hypothetical protein
MAAGRPGLRSSASARRASPTWRRSSRSITRPNARIWRRSSAPGRNFGATLGAAAPKPAPLSPAIPSAARALAEVALPQVRINYDAGLEYGRNTQPEFGLYYVGVGDAQRQFVSMLRGLVPATSPARTRAAAPLDRVGDRRRAVRSPGALPAAHGDRSPQRVHRRELGAQRSAAVRRRRPARTARCSSSCRGRCAPQSCATPTRLPIPATLATQLTEFRARLIGGRIDHSIGTFFVERAEAALESAALGGPPVAGGGDAGRAATLFRGARASAAVDDLGARGCRDGAGDRHPGPLAVYLKRLRSSRSAGTERGRGVQRAAKFVEENYGESELAKRFGVRRYPAIFVNDVLVATPKDFGFYGSGEGENNGRYAPIRSAASHAKFRADLSKAIALFVAGRKTDAKAMAAPADTGEVAGAAADFSHGSRRQNVDQRRSRRPCRP